MGSKSASILKLKELGLNTPVVCVLGDDLALTKFIQNIPPDWTRVSIRTDMKSPYTSWGLPFYPNKDRRETYSILTKLGKCLDKIDIIVSKGIDLHDTIMSGKYMRDPVQGDIIEYVLGPSTVRDIDKGIPNSWKIGGKMPHDLLSLQLPVNLHYSLSHTIEQTDRGFRAPYILEFSVYPYGVGKLHKSLIFWEVIEEKRQ